MDWELLSHCTQTVLRFQLADHDVNQVPASFTPPDREPLKLARSQIRALL